jgi:hypothetical protein
MVKRYEVYAVTPDETGNIAVLNYHDGFYDFGAAEEFCDKQLQVDETSLTILTIYAKSV